MFQFYYIMYLILRNHKWKIFMLFCLLYLKKHYKYILFYFYSKTKKGHAMIENKKEKVGQNMET